MENQEQAYDVIFLFPGNAASGLQAISSHVALSEFMMQGKKVGLRHSRSCNIYGVRNRSISTRTSEKYQKPFEGTVYENYKNLVWVDSDNHIQAKQIARLISHDVDIVAGWYRQYMMGPICDDNLTACGYRDMEYFKEEDRTLLRQPLKHYGVRPIRISDLPQIPRTEKGLIEVDYAGMGCMVMKKGVLESLEYPWVMSWVIEWEQNGVRMAEIITDDDGLMIRLKEKGFKIFVDPECPVGHEKPVVL